MPSRRLVLRWLIACRWILIGSLVSDGVAAGAETSDTPTRLNVHRRAFHSAALGRELNYLVYLPRGYAEADEQRYPVVYLLHGRGDTMDAWETALPDLERLVVTGTIPPVIAILPDAPFTRRAGYYIDSVFAGDGSPDSAGMPVETALTTELIRHVDTIYRTSAERSNRIIAGYSMGGYGALRYALAHPEVFGGAIALSPAVYEPLPPRDSSAREFGAFGQDEQPFLAEAYRSKNYPALLPAFAAQGLPLRLFIAVGDDEFTHADPAEWKHDLDYEAHTLYNHVRRVTGIAAELRVLDGGHEWTVWRPAFIEGLKYVLEKTTSPRDSDL